MKRFVILVLVLLLGLGIGFGLVAKADNREDVKKVIVNFVAAYNQDEAIEPYLLPDFTVFSQEGDALARGFDLEAFDNPRNRGRYTYLHHRLELRDLEVQVYDKSALVTGYFEGVFVFPGGSSIIGPSRVSIFAVKKEATWKIAHIHASGLTALKYLCHLPYDPEQEKSSRKWPMILFLHGLGERGSDLEMLKVHGIPKVVEEMADFPFIAISPQCPEGSWWPDKIGALKRMLDEVEQKYPVDPDRIYLTGLSMGGYGVWSLAMACPGRFAAIAPICGGGNPEKAYLLKKVPVWVFHGAEDPLVSLESSEKMVKALKTGGGEVRFTVYPDTGHDSWTKTYENPELYQWFLQHELHRKK
jgi:predicted esterase